MRKRASAAICMIMVLMAVSALAVPEMVLVKAGTFLMGDEVGDLPEWAGARPVHTVTLTYDYWIGKYEVTFDEYDAFCDATGRSKPNDRGWGRGTRPVINVSWLDAIAYCNWLSDQNGLARAYDSNGNLLNRSGQITTDITQVEGYRLPTEAEWEYAARGGHKSTADYNYAGSNNLDEVGWYWENSNPDFCYLHMRAIRKTQPVSQKKANELGLHDMSGNVWEWCHDLWDWDYYEEGNKTNPIGSSSRYSSRRVLRGGSWDDDAQYCRVARREYDYSVSTRDSWGFRLTRTNIMEEKATEPQPVELTLAEQEALANKLFSEIREKDEWDLEAIEALFLRVIEEAPDTRQAEESYWRLSNMYMQAFSPSRKPDAITLLEQYLDRYPESLYLDQMFPLFARPGWPIVQNRLLMLYDDEGQWEKAAALYTELIPDPVNVPAGLLDHLISYGRAMERAEYKEKAIQAYETYLERNERPGSILERSAKSRLEELRKEETPEQEPTEKERILPDPGTLENYRGQTGQIFHFKVTGTTRGNLWGDEIYTDDSHLGKAAVHAGLLADGEEGIVIVEIMAGQSSYPAKERNGIFSESWGRWHGSFRFVGLPPTEEQEEEEKEAEREEASFPYAGEMVLVKAGTFQMGDEVGDLPGWVNASPVHTVTLTYDYWIGKYEVTFAEYDAFCDATGRSSPGDQGWGRGTRPVINVSWNDAIAYCNWLSQREGLKPAYDSSGNLLDRNGRTTTDITQVEGYRLPTEAEWEYAARGGHKSTADYRYAGSNNINDVAWYGSNSRNRTQPVGQKKANELGLHDMSGNVWEWCHDWYGSYTSDNKIDPIGPSTGSYRVLRGGGWITDALGCRVAFRVSNSPGFTSYSLGFRLSRTNIEEKATDIQTEEKATEPQPVELTLAEQEALANKLFSEIREKDEWDLEAIEALFLRVIEEARDTRQAEESYWRLSSMYMQAFSPSRKPDAITLLEQYLDRYPESSYLDQMFPLFARPGWPIVQNRLLMLYDDEGQWEKAAALYTELIPDPVNVPAGLLDHLISYGRAMERAGYKEKAIQAYETYLERNERPGSILERSAKSRLEELKGEPTPEQEPTEKERILPDPGTLENYRGQTGEIFHFKVTGTTRGNLWGDEIYTDDSHLGKAAVHAGLLTDGEEGIVIVEIMPGQSSYPAKERNGILSVSWGRWHGSFRFLGLLPADEQEEEEKEAEREEASFPYAGEMVLVKGGTFQMGDEVGDLPEWAGARPVHTVTLTYDFWIGTYEVTFAEYDAFCDATGRSKPDDRGWGREARPVISVSWTDAIAYCNWLSQKEGLKPAYDNWGNLLDRNGRRTTDITQVEGYRLPTEAEWEYAARGGHQSVVDYKYAGSNNIEEVAWYDSNSGQKTQPVGQKKPNELGLYDMSGNVFEWCHDRYGDYTDISKTNPIGSSTGSYRVIRGGCWRYAELRCRIACRGTGNPHDNRDFLGFRLARTNIIEEKATEPQPVELTLAEQEALANKLFAEIREKDEWDLEAIEALFLRVIEEAPDTIQAEESYWRLSNMYMQAFSPSRKPDAITLLEQYLDRYPSSYIVINRLLILYQDEGQWEKAAALYTQLIPDPVNVPAGLLDHLIGYGRVMERAGFKEKAIQAYETYLERNERPGSILEISAKSRLEELKGEPTPEQEATEKERILPDPGTLENYRGQTGEIFHFKVTGTTRGNLWGDEIYTDDSRLGKAAVHAGLLADGEEGIVIVEIMAGQSSYPAKERNGILSESWGRWHGSFRFVGLPPTEEQEAEEKEAEEKEAEKEETSFPYAGEMVLVKAGTFQMGDEVGDLPEWAGARPVHTVTLTYDYLIGKYEVTFAEYDAFCDATGRDKPHDGPSWGPNTHWGRGTRPVIDVSWWDAIAYCNWLSQEEGLPVAYRLRSEPDEGSLLDANGDVTEDITQVEGYRLPTEAEWEYAARGGHKNAADYKYAGSNDINEVAWYRDNSGGKTQPVGQKKANELGLHDMSGNVWEWCHDRWGSKYYEQGNKTNPIGPTSGPTRFYRGGSWDYDALNCRVAYRGRGSPGLSHSILGFRVARTIF